MNALLADPQHLADAIARHALPLYLCALCIACAVAFGAHAAARRLRPAGGRSSAQILRIGVTCMLCAVLLFAALASAVSGDGPLLQFDHALATAMPAHLSEDALRLFARITHFGDTVVLTTLCSAGALALLVGRQSLFAATLVLAIGGNSLLNHGLKSVFERVRPLHVHGHALETSWSFPSGHSSGTLVAYGMVAYVLMQWLPAHWHRPLLLAAVAIVLSTAVSRIMLHVHYASDVLAGLASGTTWLTACIIVAALLRQREPRMMQPGGQTDA